MKLPIFPTISKNSRDTAPAVLSNARRSIRREKPRPDTRSAERPARSPFPKRNDIRVSSFRSGRLRARLSLPPDTVPAIPSYRLYPSDRLLPGPERRRLRNRPRPRTVMHYERRPPFPPRVVPTAPAQSERPPQTPLRSQTRTGPKNQRETPPAHTQYSHFFCRAARFFFRTAGTRGKRQRFRSHSESSSGSSQDLCAHPAIRKAGFARYKRRRICADNKKKTYFYDRYGLPERRLPNRKALMPNIREHRRAARMLA